MRAITRLALLNQQTQADVDIAHGRAVLDQEIRGLQELADSLDEQFALAVECMACIRGRVIVCGMGKSGLVARKIAATSSFRFAAPSAAPAPDDDVACRYDSARVSITVTTQVMHFPACHGICARPSGRFPFDLMSPTGSLSAGALARPSARHTRSFKA